MKRQMILFASGIISMPPDFVKAHAYCRGACRRREDRVSRQTARRPAVTMRVRREEREDGGMKELCAKCFTKSDFAEIPRVKRVAFVVDAKMRIVSEERTLIQLT